MPCSNRPISPGSKQQSLLLGARPGQTDGQVPNRYTDPALPTMQAVPETSDKLGNNCYLQCTTKEEIPEDMKYGKPGNNCYNVGKR